MENSYDSTRVTFSISKSGQARPYADHVCQGEIFIEWIRPFTNAPLDWTPVGWRDTIAKQYLKGHRFFYEKGDPRADWASPFLTRFENVGPGRWAFEITEAFTD